MRAGRPALVVGHHPNALSRHDTAADHGDFHLDPVADAVVRGEALDLQSEALLRLDRNDLRAPSAAQTENRPRLAPRSSTHPMRGIEKPARRYTFRQYISRAPAV